MRVKCVRASLTADDDRAMGLGYVRQEFHIAMGFTSSDVVYDGG